MMSRKGFASLLLACAATFGLDSAHLASAASAGLSSLNTSDRGWNRVIEIKHRGRDPGIVLPIAPSYLAYDYPYYLRRGHYPTHIGGPGYVYYGLPYSYRNAPGYGRRRVLGHALGTPCL